MPHCRLRCGYPVQNARSALFPYGKSAGGRSLQKMSSPGGQPCNRRTPPGPRAGPRLATENGARAERPLVEQSFASKNQSPESTTQDQTRDRVPTETVGQRSFPAVPYDAIQRWRNAAIDLRQFGQVFLQDGG